MVFKDRFRELRIRMLLGLGIVFAVFLGIFYREHQSAVLLVREQVARNCQGAMKMYIHGLDESLYEIESYLASVISSTDFLSYVRFGPQWEKYVLEQRLTEKFKKDVLSYRSVDCLFAYNLCSDAYMYGSISAVTGPKNTQIRAAVKKCVEAEQVDLSQWFFMKWEGTDYLVRMFYKTDTYVGAVVQVSTLLEQSEIRPLMGADALAFCLEDGTVVGSSLPCTVTRETLLGEHLYTLQDGRGASAVNPQEDHGRYMLIAAPSQKGSFYLAAALNDDTLIKDLGSWQRLLRMFLYFVIAMIALFLLVMNRWIFKPLYGLCQSLKIFGSGDLTHRMKGRWDCREFQEVYSSFNQMAEEISDLKIGFYEEQMERQKYQLQYYKLQINPHFYINCLNIIHNMTLTNKNEMIRQMTSYLGQHLRYAMEDRTLDMLFRELDYVDNYLKIQSIRFHGGIESNIYVADEALKTWQVPPFVIQTFVENSIKYQIVPGEVLQIDITVKKADEGMEILICDSGDGFLAPVLENLRQGKRIVDERGEHYGIYNVVQRLRLIYGGRATVDFFNHSENGGACVRIWIPPKSKQEDGNGIVDCG